MAQAPRSLDPPPRRRIRLERANVVAVVRATAHEAMTDDVEGEAAKMAFYFFLSLFPLVLIVFALTGIIGGDEAFGRMVAIARGVVPSYAWEVVEELLREITDRERPGMLSVGIVLTLWAASSGVVGLVEAFNRMYDLREGRGWWRRRALALGVLAAAAVLAVLAATAIVLGLDVVREWRVSAAWRYARWPVAFCLTAAGMWLTYVVLPARPQRDVLWETAIGAVAATALWAAATAGFGAYVANVAQYGRTYGAMGAVIALLLWLYLTSGCVLLGAELAAVLERRREPSGGEARA